MGRILRTKSALDDADAIYDFIAGINNSPIAAEKLFDKIEETLLLLSEHPYMGEAQPNLRTNTRRFIVRKNYLLFFEPIDGGIRLLRLLHAKIDISDALFGSL